MNRILGQELIFGITAISFWRPILVASLMLITAIFLSVMSHGEDTHLRKEFSSFPKQIGEWTGKESFFEQKIYDVLGVDDSTLITYSAPGNKVVQLYIGYYQSQREGDLIHSPKHCMPGGGWEITSTSINELTIAEKNNTKIKIIKLILEKGLYKQVVLYWFQSRGRYISSEYWQKIYLVIDAITKNRTDGSFVRLIAPVTGKSIESTTAYLKSFASALIPILDRYIPGKTKTIARKTN